MRTHQLPFLLLTSAAAALFTGCGDDAGSGSASILVQPEDVIIEGLAAGTDAEDIQDGWNVTFDKYIVAIGDIDIHLATNESIEAEAPEVYVLDLTQIPAMGLDLFSFSDLRTGRWEFGYSTPAADATSLQHSSVDTTDFDSMVANGWTYLVEGTLDAADGQSCPPAALATPGTATPNGNLSGTDPCYDATSVAFRFGAEASTEFTLCEIDEVQGFAVSNGSNSTAAATIHGDHLFFNGFPEGDEGGISRLAQWLADCDLDLDGVVTATELAAIAPAQLPEIDDRFQLGGSPIPFDNMFDYLRAQMKTQGHFQGEGECGVDGEAHHED